jgi:hypothetical protein
MVLHRICPDSWTIETNVGRLAGGKDDETGGL